MIHNIKFAVFCKYLTCLIAINLAFLSSAFADELPPPPAQDENTPVNLKTGIEIGILAFLGADYRFFYRDTTSPWLIGFRYLDFKDDFMNEAAYGFQNDSTDKKFTTLSGIYLNYLYSHEYQGSFYLGGALYNTKLKLQCQSISGLETDNESSINLYLGGGYRLHFNSGFGFEAGMLLAPFFDYQLSTSMCSEEGNGDFDVNLSIFYEF